LLYVKNLYVLSLFARKPGQNIFPVGDGKKPPADEEGEEVGTQDLRGTQRNPERPCVASKASDIVPRRVGAGSGG